MIKKRTTLDDVATEAKCSVSMVSYVLRTGEKGNSSPATRRRIYDAVRKLNYHIDIAAKTLRTGKSQSVGVLFPDVDLDYIYPLMIALEKEFRKYDYFLYHSFFDSAKEESIAYSISRLEALKVEAIITPGLTRRTAMNSRVPLIIWGNNRENYDCVFPDKEFLGKDIIDFLQKLGHRRIAAAGLLEDIRYDAMRSRLLEYDEKYFFNGIASAENGIKSFRSFFSLPQPPTAIVYHSDLMAIAAMREAAMRQIRIPEDLTIIGFGEHSLAPHTLPALTTYSQNLDETAAHLAQATMNRLRTPDIPLQKIPVPVKFIPRESHAEVRIQVATL